MGKKKDQKSDKRADEGSGAETARVMAATPVTPPPAAKPAKKPAAKGPAAPKAPPAPKAASAPTPAGKAGSSISTEDIALRAYFISEKRHKQGLHGNEHLDWLEAERQLVAEQKKAKKKPVS